LKYFRVSMPLIDVVSGDFFSQYIKSGHVLMVSSGRPRVDNRFSLIDGVLKLDLDKETYERCGLSGKPSRSDGRFHVVSRYAVELDLRLPSMVRGKKGFDRVVRAFTKELTEPVSWLFLDLQKSALDAPIHRTDCKEVDVRPETTNITRTIVPLALPEDAFKDALYQEQLLEWIGLALINSPRILEADNVDPYLCRYEFPDAYSEGTTPKSVHDIVHVQWRGLIAPKFASAILSEVCQPGQEWMAYSLSSFEGALHTSFVAGDRESLCWEYG